MANTNPFQITFPLPNCLMGTWKPIEASNNDLWKKRFSDEKKDTIFLQRQKEWKELTCEKDFHCQIQNTLELAHKEMVKLMTSTNS